MNFTWRVQVTTTVVTQTKSSTQLLSISGSFLIISSSFAQLISVLTLCQSLAELTSSVPQSLLLTPDTLASIPTWASRCNSSLLSQSLSLRWLPLSTLWTKANSSVSALALVSSWPANLFRAHLRTVLWFLTQSERLSFSIRLSICTTWTWLKILTMLGVLRDKCGLAHLQHCMNFTQWAVVFKSLPFLHFLWTRLVQMLFILSTQQKFTSLIQRLQCQPISQLQLSFLMLLTTPFWSTLVTSTQPSPTGPQTFRLLQSFNKTPQFPAHKLSSSSLPRIVLSLLWHLRGLGERTIHSYSKTLESRSLDSPNLQHQTFTSVT